MIRKGWWKLLAFVLLFFTSIYGFIVKVPKLDDRLEHSIRNMFFHVPMWFAMMIFLFVSVWYAAKFLRTTSPIDDFYSKAFAATGTLYGFLGLSTGAIWANYQWGSPWSGDPKQNGAAIAMRGGFAVDRRCYKEHRTIVHVNQATLGVLDTRLAPKSSKGCVVKSFGTGNIVAADHHVTKHIRFSLGLKYHHAADACPRMH